MIDTGTTWHTPPQHTRLATGEVHVWRAVLDVPVEQVEQLRRLLIADEISRADRFYFERDRHRFAVARGALRAILSRYTGIEPQQIAFCYGEKGKPALAEHIASDIRFNISHSHGLALYAIARDSELGIDLEHIRDGVSYEEIAQRFFSPREAATLQSLPPNERKRAFFTCWTRKEAYIKARGIGLTLGLDSFDVTLRPDEPARITAAGHEAPEAARWSLHALAPGEDYAAALAIEGHAWSISCWQWSNEIGANQRNV